MISLHSLADLPEKVVVGVPGVELHVVPEVDGDAAVGLAEVVEPQARQVQHVAGIHPHVERVGILKSRINRENIKLCQLCPETLTEISRFLWLLHARSLAGCGFVSAKCKRQAPGCVIAADKARQK